MKWSEDFATGVTRIDDQHKMIFQMSEDFREALDEEKGETVYSDMLQILNAYTLAHFGYEERCMHEHKCPFAEKNKDAHARFMGMLSQFNQRFEDEGFDYSDAYKLVDTIDSWLASHIGKIDIHLKKCLNGVS